MSDGPYRDLGSGFARLSGSEAPRRAPSFISSVEDALFELLRNARDAGAENIFVASALRSRRYRSLTVIDDGCGVPESHAEIIFEPGVTTRHLAPKPDSKSPHGAGLALHHIKNAAVEAELRHPSGPTSFRAVFDTRAIPEKSLQSETRASTRSSKSNLLATVKTFARENPDASLFCASPATILASLFESHIIRKKERSEVGAVAERLGLEVSSKTVGRVFGGEVLGAERVGGGRDARPLRPGDVVSRDVSGGRTLYVGESARAEVAEILRREAGASYMEVFDIKFETRPGEVRVTARIHEPEDEYG